jgi:hypothetical protein
VLAILPAATMLVAMAALFTGLPGLLAATLLLPGLLAATLLLAALARLRVLLALLTGLLIFAARRLICHLPYSMGDTPPSTPMHANRLCSIPNTTYTRLYARSW